jgi:hypothetical protein
MDRPGPGYKLLVGVQASSCHVQCILAAASSQSTPQHTHQLAHTHDSLVKISIQSTHLQLQGPKDEKICKSRKVHVLCSFNIQHKASELRELNTFSRIRSMVFTGAFITPTCGTGVSESYLQPPLAGWRKF